MRRILLSAGLLLMSLAAQAQCTAVATINEDFSDFNPGSSNPLNDCWNKIAPGYPNGLVYPDATGDNKYVVFYGGNGTGALSYFIGPEVNTFDGAHQLSFSTWKLALGATVPAGTVSITVGTITSLTDGTTFVPFGETLTVDSATPVTFNNIVIPSAPAGSHIAWRFSTTSQHNAVAIDNVVWDAVPCPAVTAINEDFTDFTAATTFPFNCWDADAGAPPSGPMVYVAAPGSVTYYAGSNNTTPAYLISPEVSNMDGAHKLDFTATLAGPSTGVSIQLGYYATGSDAFVPVGDVLNVTASNSTFTNNIFPAITGNARIAFQFTGVAPHQAATIDNVIWDEVPAPGCEVLTALNEDFTDFATGVTLPFNCWSSIAEAEGPMVYTGSAGGSITFYASTAPGVAAYLISPELSTFDGNHQLTFDARKSTGGTVTIQPGYITNPADYTTFVPVGEVITPENTVNTYPVAFPEQLTGTAHIAFKYIGATMHQAAVTDNVVWDVAPSTTCATVETFTEDFANFTTATTFPASCWNALAGTPPNGPMVYVASEGSVTYYAGSNNTTPAYLISPEVSTIDGAHKLDFTTSLAGPSTVVNVQPGYITNVADAETFVSVGNLLTITASNNTFSNIVFPAITGNAHIAFKFTSVAPHQAAIVDSASWTPVTNSNDSFSKKAFTLYPNPATGSVNLVNNANAEGTVTIYSLTGAQVFNAKTSTGTQNLNLSELQSGMYLVKVQTGTTVSTQKLVIK